MFGVSFELRTLDLFFMIMLKTKKSFNFKLYISK